MLSSPRPRVGVVLAISAVCFCIADSSAAEPVRAFVLPPSELWSPEYRKYSLEPAGDYPPVPARDAPKAEWDQFDAAENRINLEMVAKAKERYPVQVEQARIAGVPAAIVTPKAGVAARNEHRVLINLHGGGFVSGRGTTFGQAESIPVAAIGGFKVITLDYRQAPFHSYPAASEDVEAVYRELLKTYEPEAIGIYGCSAGGSLTAQSVAWFAAKGLPRPGAVGILCMMPPQVSAHKHFFWGAGDSEVWASATQSEEAKKKIEPSWDAADWYMSAADKKDPRAYPGSFDEVLAKFPPTLFLVGTREIFMSPTIVAHARMLRLHVDASLYVMEGAPHAAHVTAVGTPEAHDANAFVARFFDQNLAR